MIWIILLLPRLTYAQYETTHSPHVPFTDLFYHLDSHLLGSFAYSNGFFHLAAIATTYALVKTGADWNWYTYAYTHGLSNSYIAAEMGTFVPVVVPLTLYLYVRSRDSQV